MRVSLSAGPLLAVFLLVTQPATAVPLFMGLGDVSGGLSDNAAWAVSANGLTVVGDASTAAGTEAFVWDAANGMQGLGTLRDAGSDSSALGVSVDGSTVVGTSISAAAGTEAFFWDTTSGMQTVAAMLAAKGVLVPPDWTLSTALAISPDGGGIAGGGINPGGNNEAWVAFVPEPSANQVQLVALVALACLAAARRLLDGLERDGTRLPLPRNPFSIHFLRTPSSHTQRRAICSFSKTFFLALSRGLQV